jgi:hypothetical protein
VPLENLDDSVDNNRVQGIIRENNTSEQETVHYYKLNGHKPWFNIRCSELLEHRQQAKLQWLQDPSQIISNNLNSVRCEASTHFRRKINELATQEYKQ